MADKSKIESVFNSLMTEVCKLLSQKWELSEPIGEVTDTEGEIHFEIDQIPFLISWTTANQKHPILDTWPQTVFTIYGYKIHRATRYQPEEMEDVKLGESLHFAGALMEAFRTVSNTQISGAFEFVAEQMIEQAPKLEEQLT